LIIGKASGIDLTPILHQPMSALKWGRYRQMDQDHGLEKIPRRDAAARHLRAGHRTRRARPRRPADRNVHRVVGTITGSEVTKKHGPNGLPEDTIHLKFTGSAGQSLGAFMPKGMTIELEGDAKRLLRQRI